MVNLVNCHMKLYIKKSYFIYDFISIFDNIIS
jgi:hypothetical protein